MSELAPASYVERLWDLGQRHLAAGRYVSARRHLEAAEQILWRKRDVAALARIYLPLLETRRQLRQLAVDGVIVIGDGRAAGKILLSATSGVLVSSDAAAVTGALIASRRTGRPYDALRMVRDRKNRYVASAVDPVAAAGLRVVRAESEKDVVDPEIRPEMTIQLPASGVYKPGTALHALARESLLVAWEALALKWQSRHAAPAEPWAELAHCREALRMDPACEPITMRLMAVAEAIAKR